MMDTIPDKTCCIKMLKQAGCSKEVIAHCNTVCDVAVRIAKKTSADVSLVTAGALLHDIGRSKSHGIDHAIAGANIARKLGLSEKIVHIIERHIGAGLSSSVAVSLGLPKKNYIPRTLEEKIVCHADNLIDDCRRQPIEKEVERALMDGKKEYALQLIRLHKNLSELCKIDLNDI
jgi:uncharacterized protein (TIGR00295 family)